MVRSLNDSCASLASTAVDSGRYFTCSVTLHRPRPPTLNSIATKPTLTTFKSNPNTTMPRATSGSSTSSTSSAGSTKLPLKDSVQAWQQATANDKTSAPSQQSAEAVKQYMELKKSLYGKTTDAKR